MIKEHDEELIAKQLIKNIYKIEQEEAQQLNRKSATAVVDRLFKEFQKLVDEYENTES
jgi:hypothetical protein